MHRLTIKKLVVILVHALIIWALCGTTIMVGRALMSMSVTLIIHAIAAPVFAALVSWFYYRKFHFSGPLQSAAIITIFVIVMDASLVAPVFEKSYVMFTSILGTWLPISLIFLSVYFTGLAIKKKNTPGHNDTQAGIPE